MSHRVKRSSYTMDLPLSVCSCVLLPVVCDSALLWQLAFGVSEDWMGSSVSFSPGALIVLERLVVSRLL